MIGENPLVSIIVPVYNNEQYICECLESVRTQSYRNFECIIVDDCWNDNNILSAQKQIQAWGGDSRFRIIRRSEQGGPSAARNTGMDNSRGDYIYFMDGDDKIMPKALELLVAVAMKYDKVQMVQGNVIHEDGNKMWQFSPNDFPEYSDDRAWIRAQMLKWGISVTAWNKLYRSDYIKANGLRFLEGIIHEDGKWCWDNQKVLQSIAFCNYHCYWYRTSNPNSIMHNDDKTDSSVSCIKILQSISNEIQDEIEMDFVKRRILPYDVTLHLWAFSKDRKKIRRVMKGILKAKKAGPLLTRCLLLYLSSYIFPFNIYRRNFPFIKKYIIPKLF